MQLFQNTGGEDAKHHTRVLATLHPTGGLLLCETARILLSAWV